MNKPLVLLLKIVLVLCCVLFLLISACGGLFSITAAANWSSGDSGSIFIFAFLCLVLGGAGVYACIKGYKNLNERLKKNL